MLPKKVDDPAARAAAVAAASLRIEPGMTIGLGSGRAVRALVEVLGRHGRGSGRPPLRVAVASSATEAHARAAGLEVVPLDDLALDLVVDGADEIDPRLDLIKGGGAALLREKLLAAAGRKVLIVAEHEKYVERLGGGHPLPVEVVPFAWPMTRRRLLRLVPEAELRRRDDGTPLVTDEGHYLLDCRLPPEADLAGLAAAVKGTLGVVEHGLFLGVASEVLLGHPDGSVRRLVRAEPPGAPGVRA
jgi:ribose 5-phosphate isomerase A